MRKKKKRQITLSDGAKENLLQWAEENHIAGGLSGAIEYLAWKIELVGSEREKNKSKQ